MWCRPFAGNRPRGRQNKGREDIDEGNDLNRKTTELMELSGNATTRHTETNLKVFSRRQHHLHLLGSTAGCVALVMLLTIIRM